jgi:hypothetical protein
MPQSGDELTPFKCNYSFGPFAFSSNLELPELPALGQATGIPVSVMLGRAPLAVEAPTFQGEICSTSRSEFLLRIPEVARYYVRNGAEIIVEPEAGASPLDVRGYLLSNVFAVLCHQRRLLPLHASAVRMGDGVVAFLGNSGAGKSTLAAFLARAGNPLVADDLCLLDPEAPAAERVLPVAPWLKLWRSSLEALGQGTDGLVQTFSDEDKFRVPTGGAGLDVTRVAENVRLPLRAVVVLERGQGGVKLLPLNPVNAIAQMMRFTYQAYLLGWLGLQEEHFSSCGKGLAGASAYTCERAWTFESLPTTMERLREEFE